MFVPFVKSLIKKYWPIIALIFSSGVLFLANYQPGSYLMGWDNTAPELNLPLNLTRFIFGVWQEYRGLGTLDGMAHVANIVHWLYAAILSGLFGPSLVRYTFNILAHLMGGIGMYVLMSQDILPTLLQQKNSRSTFVTQAVGLFSAWFYLFNLMTIQMFYTPLELFSTHFAILPWSILTLRQYLRTGTAKQLLSFFLVALLGVSQAHVPTIVIPYAVLMGSFLLTHLFSGQKNSWRQVITAALILLGVQVFWAMPYAYGVLHKSVEIAAAKQNRLGTPGTFFRNFAWSDIKSISTWGGFQLDYYDWNQAKQSFEPIMQPWVSLHSQPVYQAISWGFSLLSLAGVFICIIYTVRHKTWQWAPLLLSWLFVIVMLGTDIPVAREFSSWLRETVPLFAQVFRFTFTKFSLLYVCLVSVFLGVALVALVNLLRRFNWSTVGKIVLTGLLISSGWWISRPAFQGFFFYPSLRVKIPDQYFQLANYLSTSQPLARIASLPIHSLWGWTTSSNQWGYRGSGFIWQAIRQPMIDRSFDPWSKENETMFLQLNHALYRQDANLFLNTLRKYHTDLILRDRSIFHPGNYPENLFTAETDQFLADITEIQPLAEFDQLELLQVENGQRNLQPQLLTQVTRINDSYRSTYTTKDQAYADHGDYIMVNDQVTAVTYPFSQLQQEQVPTQTITNNQLAYQTTASTDQTVVIPPYSAAYPWVTGALSATKNNNDITFTVELQLPELWLNGQKLTSAPRKFMQTVPMPTGEAITLTVGNEHRLPITLADLSAQPLLITQLQIESSVKDDVAISIPTTNHQSRSLIVPLATAMTELDQLGPITLANADELTITIPLGEFGQFVYRDTTQRGQNQATSCRPAQGKVEKNIRLSGTEYISQHKGLICDTRYFPEIATNAEYLFHWAGETVTGAGLRTQVLNPQTKRFDLDIISDRNEFDAWYTLYPSQNIYQSQPDDLFTVVLNGESYGREQNKVLLQEMSVIPVPLNWLTGIYFQPTNQAVITNSQGTIFDSKKLGTTFYELTVDVTQDSWLALPQSFDSGWVAINRDQLFQFLPHYRYNGWGNAWQVPAGSYKLWMIYWPQLLVFIGYGVLLITGGYVISRVVTSRHSQAKSVRHPARIKRLLAGKS